MVLLQEEHVCDACLLTAKIIDKCGCEGSKTLPRLPKIEPVATMSSKKTTNISLKSARSAEEPAKSEEKPPKSEKCANMVSTCGGFGSDLGDFGPPSKLMQKSKRKKCLWDLTRQALPAARRISERFWEGFGRAKWSQNRDFWYFFGYACGDLIFGRILLDFS